MLQYYHVNALLSLTTFLKIYERGVELFTYPVSFEIWNIYLAKFVKRYVRTPGPVFHFKILKFEYLGR